MSEGNSFIRRRSVLTAAGTVGVAALAGCTGSSSGPTVDVVENEYEDELELDDHEVENDEVLGTNAAVLEGTITNTGEETVE
ncbi:hypothetical protein [Natronolimnohabitans innermongolicus]|uniref:DUF8130 domain-containing protein n=1 Tax=Natronolimnohabitans innermongolicus JCM 12255 TaxID=1227499 RepID=L9WJS5_9EURY|nr:hypothetical protein [Natronolimnohabitans innermongolicus]ELY49627.1 hypothetical protein C493_20060 [Natronolimnohabitans innermongolicus JCM 12255]